MVETADTKAAVREFVDYPYRKYAGDRRWVAPLRIGQFETLDPKVNPFWQHADQRLFLARRGGVVVGRIAYIDDDNHNRIHDENLVFFGFFEADDEEAARALLTAVEHHARERGRDAVRGPLNPTLNDGAGFQLHAFDDAPYVMMPQSPPEYPAWTEAAGYTKVKDLYAFYFDNRRPIEERVARIAERRGGRPEVAGIVVNRLGRTRDGAYWASQLAEAHPGLVRSTVVRLRAAIAEAAARSLPVNALTRPGAAEAAEELDALYRELFGVPEPATAGTPPGSHGADSSLHAAYDLGYAVRP